MKSNSIASIADETTSCVKFSERRFKDVGEN